MLLGKLVLGIAYGFSWKRTAFVGSVFFLELSLTSNVASPWKNDNISGHQTPPPPHPRLVDGLNLSPICLY